jgi:FAD/FMN-containing dehydrogenase
VDRFWALPRFPFRVETVRVAPEDTGIYALFDDEEAVYIGRAAERTGGIRAQLLVHLRNVGNGRLGRVTCYTWELTNSPEGREAVLLARFIQEHLRFPRGHEAA